MSFYAHPDVLDGGLNALRSAVAKILMLKTYAFGDSYATVTGNAIASADLVAADVTISSNGNNRQAVTSSSKTGTATATSNQYEAGTATGGSTTTLADTSKAWATNVHANRAVTIMSGTGAGQSSRIASNTGTVLTLSVPWTTAPDATSVYRISDDIHFALTDGSGKVLYVADEKSNQPVTSGNPVNFPALTYTSGQPAGV